jgi:hypothetical protein
MLHALIVSSQFVMTMDLKAEYCEWICESSTDQNLWNIRFLSYLEGRKH